MLSQCSNLEWRYLTHRVHLHCLLVPCRFREPPSARVFSSTVRRSSCIPLPVWLPEAGSGTACGRISCKYRIVPTRGCGGERQWGRGGNIALSGNGSGVIGVSMSAACVVWSVPGSCGASRRGTRACPPRAAANFLSNSPRCPLEADCTAADRIA